MRLPSRRRVPKTSDFVAREIADEIITSNLAVGAMLPPEHEMIAALGVGRTTLREALRVLEARGVITIKVGPGGGPVVRRPAATDLAEGLTLILAFESATLEEVVGARVALESTLVRSAASAPDQSERVVERLTVLNEELKAHVGDHEFTALYEAWHSALALGVGGPGTELFVQPLLAIFGKQGVQDTSDAPAHRKIVASHSRLLKAIAAGDAAAAERTIQRHLNDYYKTWRSGSPEAFARPIRWAV